MLKENISSIQSYQPKQLSRMSGMSWATVNVALCGPQGPT